MSGCCDYSSSALERAYQEYVSISLSYFKNAGHERVTLTCGVSGMCVAPHRHWYGQTSQNLPTSNHNLPFSGSGVLTPLPPAQYRVHGRLPLEG